MEEVSRDIQLQRADPNSQLLLPTPALLGSCAARLLDARFWELGCTRSFVFHSFSSPVFSSLSTLNSYPFPLLSYLLPLTPDYFLFPSLVDSVADATRRRNAAHAPILGNSLHHFITSSPLAHHSSVPRSLTHHSLINHHSSRHPSLFTLPQLAPAIPCTPCIRCTSGRGASCTGWGQSGRGHPPAEHELWAAAWRLRCSASDNARGANGWAQPTLGSVGDNARGASGRAQPRLG